MRNINLVRCLCSPTREPARTSRALRWWRSILSMDDIPESSEPHLPIELWETIFDDLDSEQDKRTLVACSVSCKTLLAPSYRRLYYDITLASPAIAQLFVRAISSQSLHPPATYVRRLSIQCHNLPSDLNSIIPILAQYLPALSVLCLVSLDWSSIDHRAKSALTTGFQTVYQLELFEVLFQTEGQALEFIASFPSLTHLTRCCEFVPEFVSDAQVPLPRPLPLPGGLKALDISIDYVEMFDRLLRLEPHLDLHTLRLNFLDMRDEYVWSVGRLLEFLGLALNPSRSTVGST